MKELIKEAYANEFGQIINPGDEVIYAGTSWKQTAINKGVFAGVYKNSKDQVVSVRVNDVPYKRWNYDYDLKKGYYTNAKRHSILPLKRVYKIDTKFVELSGKTF